RQVVGIGVHFVAAPGLARPAMAAAIVGDAAISAGAEEDHLIFPGIGAQRPAMAEDDRPPASPILVIDLRPIPRRDGAHGVFSLGSGGRNRSGFYRDKATRGVG